MKNKIKSFTYRFLATPLGHILVLLLPKKAKQLSENRITLIHKNKNSMSVTERLMRASLVKNLDKIEDYDTIAEQNRNFWVAKAATDLFSETEETFQTDFLPNCTFIFDLLKEEMSDGTTKYDTLVEIGTGNGDVLNYLSSKFQDINRFIGIDLSQNQIEINTKKYNDNTKLEFVTADAIDWVKQYGHDKTIFVSSRGVLEYFLEDNLQEFLKDINRLGNTMFVAIEPNGGDHDFEINLNSQLYGNEPSFSHNYPNLFKNAGFKLWHFSQKRWQGGTDLQTFIGAQSNKSSNTK